MLEVAALVALVGRAMIVVRASFTARSQSRSRGSREPAPPRHPVTGEQAAGVARLPLIHNDPFNRMLVAEEQVPFFLEAIKTFYDLDV